MSPKDAESLLEIEDRLATGEPPIRHLVKPDSSAKTWCGLGCSRVPHKELARSILLATCRTCLGRALHHHASSAAQASAQLIKLGALPRGRG